MVDIDLMTGTWDVVGATNFSKDFDFLSTGCDYDNSLANSAAVND